MQASNGAKQETETQKYLCGSCGQTNDLPSQGPIQCQHCGYRILYKKRQRRLVHLLAR